MPYFRFNVSRQTENQNLVTKTVILLLICFDSQNTENQAFKLKQKSWYISFLRSRQTDNLYVCISRFMNIDDMPQINEINFHNGMHQSRFILFLCSSKHFSLMYKPHQFICNIDTNHTIAFRVRSYSWLLIKTRNSSNICTKVRRILLNIQDGYFTMCIWLSCIW